MPKKKSEPQKSSPVSKKQAKLFENLLKITYEYIKGRGYTPQSKESLIERLAIHPEHREIFWNVLQSLQESGKVHLEKGSYLSPIELKSHEKLYQGQISVHPRGFGFVNLPSPFQDIFIPKPQLNGAIDGDTVEVLVDESVFSPKGPEGKITKILKRDKTKFVATIISCSNKQAELYCSLFSSIAQPLTVPLLWHDKKLARGDRVVFSVEEWDKGIPKQISLVDHFGSINDPSSDISFAMHENNLPFSFPPEAEQEAQAMGKRVTAKDLIDRVDLRSIECITIDPDTAKDFDDAISLEKIGSRYRLGVHIADVSHYVQQGTAIDKEAVKRSNSTYFPGKCLPMLPPSLSENLCSLKPNVNRLTVSIFMDIDEQGDTLSWEISRSVIRSKKRLTYKEAKAILDGERKSTLKPFLNLMVEVALLLKKRRSQRGSVQLYMPELVVRVDKDGKPTGMERIEYDITHQMIEEFMLKANEMVAIHLNREGKEISYRVHEEPSSESLRDFSSLVSSFGFHLPQTPDPHDIQKLFQEIENQECCQYLAICYIKSMRLACYSPDNIGHYGLSLEHYCHFTSPIRRYVDLVIHRLLFEPAITKENIQSLCLAASERERISSRAEGSVISMKKLRLLSDILKEEKDRTFEAIVTRIKPFGIYFDVVEFMLEGFIHISELEDDYFIYNDYTSSLNGRFKGYDWKAGNSLLVKCESTDLILGDARWVLVEKLEKASPASVVGRSKIKLKKPRKNKTSP